MVLHRYDKEIDVLDIGFNMVTFWIKVLDLPVRFRTRAENICGAAGLVDKNTEEGKLWAMVLFVYRLRWTFQNLCVEAECFLWRRVRNFRSLSNMSSCQTCVIGAVASYMTTETAGCGLKVVACYHLRLNNMVHGSEQHLLCDKNET